jgi:hypothetical protein
MNKKKSLYSKPGKINAILAPLKTKSKKILLTLKKRRKRMRILMA